MDVKFKNFRNRHIILELQTIKTDFLFENSQDFNQTTYARPQHPIVFIHNISLYFNCISSVKYLFKRSRDSHVMSFSAIWPKHPPPKSLKGGKSTHALLWIWDFLPFSNFQNGEFQRSVQSWFQKVFFVRVSYVPFLLNNCKAKLVVNVS